jgi:trigger factor
MDMKKFYGWTAAILCAGLLLSGCGSNDTQTQAGTNAEEAENQTRTELPDYSWEGKDINDYVKLGEYKGIEYEKASAEVSDEEVESMIEQMLNSAATQEQIKEGTVKDADTVNIDFTGKIDGKEFEGGTASNQTITIGTTKMIDGFTDGLIGKSIGEEVVLNLKFPEDYGKEDLNGKDVEFTVKINYVAGEKIVPELTDEWVKGYTSEQYKTVEEFRSYVQESMKTEAEKNATTENQSAIWQQVVENASILSYPEGLVEYYYADQKGMLEDYATYYGVDYDTYIAQLGLTAEKADEELQTYAKESAKSAMVNRAIAKELNIEITDEEYKAYIDDLASTYGYEDMDELVRDAGGKISIEDGMIWERVMKVIEENAVAK